MTMTMTIAGCESQVYQSLVSKHARLQSEYRKLVEEQADAVVAPSQVCEGARGCTGGGCAGLCSILCACRSLPGRGVPPTGRAQRHDRAIRRRRQRHHRAPVRPHARTRVRACLLLCSFARDHGCVRYTRARPHCRFLRGCCSRADLNRPLHSAKLHQAELVSLAVAGAPLGAPQLQPHAPSATHSASGGAQGAALGGPRWDCAGVGPAVCPTGVLQRSTLTYMSSWRLAARARAGNCRAPSPCPCVAQGRASYAHALPLCLVRLQAASRSRAASPPCRVRTAARPRARSSRPSPQPWPPAPRWTLKERKKEAKKDIKKERWTLHAHASTQTHTQRSDPRPWSSVGVHGRPECMHVHGMHAWHVHGRPGSESCGTLECSCVWSLSRSHS
jgi:hypothetical protein